MIATPLYCARKARSGFTLVELLVVIIILAILSGLSLTGLAQAGKKGNAETTKFVIAKLSDAILDYYDSYEDVALQIASPVSPHTTRVATLRARMREELPDSWADVAPSTNVPAPTTAIGRAYQRYKAQYPDATNNTTFQGAECLYMTITASGLFPDFMQFIKSDRVGDVDNDGAREFLDGWGRPIEFMRWAPGIPYLLSGVQIPSHSDSPDPFDLWNDDPNAYALVPLIYSSGPDGATREAGMYGLVVAEDGWTNASLNNICSYKPKGSKVVGADSSQTYRDNITNHQLLVK
jgi:prepilin-type N-terminal cleavage/methylation domain-containing protein